MPVTKRSETVDLVHGTRRTFGRAEPRFESVEQLAIGGTEPARAIACVLDGRRRSTTDRLSAVNVGTALDRWNRHAGTQRQKGFAMKFSITHPIVGHPYDPELVSGVGIATVASAAERAGFHGFGFTDHPAPTERWLHAGGHDALDPFVAMAFAAARTTRLRLIPNIVVLPYRNPFVVAKAGATLDLLSGGRFTLAAGAGYLKREFEALGVDHGERNEIFDEALDVLKAIWTSDDVTFEGRHFKADGITAHPRPLSTPHPPIWIGGNSGRARERVATRGDGWCPFPAPPGVAQTARTVVLDTPQRLAGAIDDLHRRLEAAQREPGSVDIAFSSGAGGHIWSDGFNAEAHLAGMEELAALGVTWLQVGLPGDSLEHVTEAIERYGEQVIAVCA